MDQDEYLKTRLDDQVAWYDGKSAWNKRLFVLLSIVQITAAALIPFLVGYVTDARPCVKFVVGLLGVVVALTVGIIVLLRLQENWHRYRTTAETLRHEKYLFQTGSPPYDGDEAFTVLVERTEAVISREHTGWLRAVRKKGEGHG